jgi:hypothetical protein
MVAESMINGQLEQAKEQFHAMPKANRKWFLEKIIWNDLSVQLDKLQKQLFLDWL